VLIFNGKILCSSPYNALDGGRDIIPIFTRIYYLGDPYFNKKTLRLMLLDLFLIGFNTPELAAIGISDFS